MSPPRSSPDTPSTRQQGCDASGKLWLLRAIEVFATLSADAKHLQPILEVDEEILKVRQQGLDTLAKLKSVKKVSEEVVRGVEILLAYTVLQTYDDKEDMLEMLEVSHLQNRAYDRV
jgi:DNA polymerase phi